MGVCSCEDKSDLKLVCSHSEATFLYVKYKRLDKSFSRSHIPLIHRIREEQELLLYHVAFVTVTDLNSNINSVEFGYQRSQKHFFAGGCDSKVHSLIKIHSHQVG